MRGFARAAAACSLLGAAWLLVACGSADSATTGNGSGGSCEVDEYTGDTIPDPPDGPSLCPAGACNYQAQTGCAAGQSCWPTVNAMQQIEARCLAAGSGTTGDTCVNWNECAPGYACAEGACRKMCCGPDWSESACDPGEACYRELFLTVDEGDPEDDEDDVVASSNAFLCYPVGCDLFTSDDCPSGRDCKIIDPRGTTACMPPSPEGLGDRCTPPSVCGRGLSCVGDPGQERCRKLCRTEGCDPGCDQGDTCVHFNRNPPGVGECTPDWSP